MTDDEKDQAWARINNSIGKLGHYIKTHKSICVSVSGGSDSDIIGG